jgi:hypothetical protein
MVRHFPRSASAHFGKAPPVDGGGKGEAAVSVEAERGSIILEVLGRHGPLRMRELSRLAVPLNEFSLRNVLRRLVAQGQVARSGASKATTYALPSRAAPQSALEPQVLARIREHALEYGGIRRRAVASLCGINGYRLRLTMAQLASRRPGLKLTARRGVYEWRE